MQNQGIPILHSKAGVQSYGSLSFTPTDARNVTSSKEIKGNSAPLPDHLQRRGSRIPLMHPHWFSVGSYNGPSSLPEENGNYENVFGSGEIEKGSAENLANQQVIPDDDIAELSVTFNRHKYYSKLVEPNDLRMRLPDHILPSSFFSIMPTQSNEKQNSIVTIFAIWNTMMGTSLLSMPWGISQAGFSLGVILIVLGGFLTLYTAYLVLQSQNNLDFTIFEFSDICRYYLGRIGEWVAIIFALVTFLGGMMVYWVLMSNFMYTTGVFIYDNVENITVNDTNLTVLCPHVVPSSNISYLGSIWSVGVPMQSAFLKFWNYPGCAPLLLTLLVFPLLNFKSPTFFTKFNCLGTLSVFFLLALVITKGVEWGWNFNYHQPDASHHILVEPQFKSTFPALTGMLSLAFFLHNAVITIVKNNKHPENNVRDLCLGYLLVALTYLTVGIVFYCTFPLPKSCIASNLLENMKPSDTFAAVARMFLLFQMLTVFPLLAYMFRLNALYAIFNKAWPGRIHVIVVNICVVGMCVCIAVFYPHIGDIIRYSGSLCGLVYIYCLPSLVYMLAKKSQGQLNVASAAVHCIIILLGVLNFVAQFLITPAK